MKSISSLNKKFYTEISNWFLWLISLYEPNKNLDKNESFDFGINLLTDVIFRCFLQDKELEKHLDIGKFNLPNDIFFLEKEKEIELVSSPIKNKKIAVRGLFPILKSYRFSNTTTNQNTITPEILGLIFENLLAEHKNDKKSTARKFTGSYYTPNEIVDYMCKNALCSYILKQVEPLKLDEKQVEELFAETAANTFSPQEAQRILDVLQKVKILDPSCGCGAFLLGALNNLDRAISKLDTSTKSSPTKRKLEIIKNNIFGIDIQPTAIKISNLRLLLAAQLDTNNTALTEVTTNLKIANTLTDKVFTNIKFDIILGNPPYIGEKGHKSLFEPLKNSELKEFYIGKMDYFYFFFHYALNILQDGGLCAFITTNYFPTALGGKLLRKDLKERATITQLINFNELKIFKSAAGQHNLITFLTKGYAPKSECKIINMTAKGLLKDNFNAIINKQSPYATYALATQNQLYEGIDNYIRFSQDNAELSSILSKIRTNNELLGNICKVNTGIFTAKDDVFIDDAQNYQTKIKLNKFEKELLKPLFKNSDIKKFYTDNTVKKLLIYHHEKASYNLSQIPNIMEYLSKHKDELAKRKDNSLKGALKRGRWDVMALPKLSIDFNAPKIVAPHRSAINTFGYNECEWFASADVYFITNPKPEYNLKYLLCLLNSRLYYIWLYHKGKRKGETLELYKTPLCEIPIKYAPQEEQQEFAMLADKILASTHNHAEFKKLETTINNKIFKLYGITAKEAEFINKTYPLTFY